MSTYDLLAAGEFRECSELLKGTRWRGLRPLMISLVGPEPADPTRGITELFEELREPLYRYVLSIVGAEAEAEDIVQDSFLRMHTHQSAGGHMENSKAWLFRVSYNLAIDALRRKRLQSLDDATAMAVEHTDPRSLDPERLAIENQRRGRMADAVSRLSEQQRQCLTLRSEGFRHRQIAGILGVSESTVAENLRRGVLRLTRELYGA